MKALLCDTSQVGNSRGFEIEVDGKSLCGFLVSDAGHIRAYKNSCPHTGIELNWSPDQFLDLQGSYIQCSNHGALFRPSDGLCITGPCAGQSLQALAVSIREGQIYPLYPDPR